MALSDCRATITTAQGNKNQPHCEGDLEAGSGCDPRGGGGGPCIQLQAQQVEIAEETQEEGGGGGHCETDAERTV